MLNYNCQLELHLTITR